MLAAVVAETAPASVNTACPDSSPRGDSGHAPPWAPCGLCSPPSRGPNKYGALHHTWSRVLMEAWGTREIHDHTPIP